MFKIEKKDLSNRVGFIDELRGALIILVVIYHAIYLFYNMMPILTPDWLEMLQPFVYVGAGLFIFMAGICCMYSRDNFRRGIVCFGIACAITVLSLLWKGGDLQILWGILHLIGFSIILYDLFRKLLAKTKAVYMVPILVVIFIVTFRLGKGYVGIPYLLEYNYMTYGLPQFLFPIGITYKGFTSADYYPLLPWFCLFLMGTYFGRYLKSNKAPAFFYKTRVKFLAFLGRHTLLIYIVHIPVLIGIYLLLGLVF